MAQDLCLQEKQGASSLTSDMPLSSETSDSTLRCCGVPNLSSNVSDESGMLTYHNEGKINMDQQIL